MTLTSTRGALSVADGFDQLAELKRGSADTIVRANESVDLNGSAPEDVPDVNPWQCRIADTKSAYRSMTTCDTQFSAGCTAEANGR